MKNYYSIIMKLILSIGLSSIFLIAVEYVVKWDGDKGSIVRVMIITLGTLFYMALSYLDEN